MTGLPSNPLQWEPGQLKMIGLRVGHVLKMPLNLEFFILFAFLCKFKMHALHTTPQNHPCLPRVFRVAAIDVIF